MNRTILALLGASLLAGCAGTFSPPAPAVQAPAVSPPPAWQRSLPATAAGAADARWFEQFGDPALPALISAAMAASPDLAQARSRIERARAGLTAAAARLLPSVDAAASAQRGRNVPGTAAATSLTLGLQAGWEIDLFGGGRAARSAADARLQGAVAGAQQAQIALAAETAGAWVGWRACVQQVEVLQSDSASRAETARLSALRARAGLGAPADDALAQASAAQGRSQVLAQQAACEALLLGLAELTAIDEAGLRRLLAGAPATRPLPFAVTSVPADLLRQRPDLVDAERALFAAARDIDQARAALLPQVGLAGSIGASRVEVAGSRSSGSTWAIGPLQLTLPIFDAGVRQAQATVALAAYDEAAALYRAALRRAVREVEQALLNLRASSEQAEDTRRAAAGFDASLQAAQARQRAGLASLFELEDARRSSLAARSALIELDRAQAQAWIDLHRALGGGWTAPTATTAR